MTKYRSALALAALATAFFAGSLLSTEGSTDSKLPYIFGIHISPSADGQYNFDMAVYDPVTGKVVSRPQITTRAGELVNVYGSDPRAESRYKLQLKLEIEPAYEPLPDPPPPGGIT